MTINIKKIIKEIICLIIWSVIFTKIFFYDIEREFLEKYFMNLSGYFNYRIIFYCLFVIILWYALGNSRFFKNVLYLLFYPIIVFVWKLPKLAFWRIPKILFVSKSWLLIYAYINSWINHFWEFKYNLLRLALLTASLILAFKSNNKIVLYVVFTIILLLLISSLIDKFKIAFQPIRLFRLNLELSNIKEKHTKNATVQFIESFSKMENMDPSKEEYEKKHIEKVEQIILVKSMFSFITSRMKDFLNRKTYIFVFFIKTLFAFINAWLLISILNYISFKVSIDNYTVTSIPTFFDFIYYTFHSMLHGSIPQISPVGVIAKILDILALVTGLLLTGTLLTVFFTVKTEKYKKDLNEIIEFADEQLLQFETVLIEKFNFTLVQAVKFLESKESYVCSILKEMRKIEK